MENVRGCNSVGFCFINASSLLGSFINIFPGSYLGIYLQKIQRGGQIKCHTFAAQNAVKPPMENSANTARGNKNG